MPKLLDLHEAEYNLIMLLRELKFGEVVSLKVRDGLPQVADVVLKKIQFNERVILESGKDKG